VGPVVPKGLVAAVSAAVGREVAELMGLLQELATIHLAGREATELMVLEALGQAMMWMLSVAVTAWAVL